MTRVGGVALAARGQEATPKGECETGKELVRRFYDAVNCGDGAGIKAVLAPDFVDRFLVLSEGRAMPPGSVAIAAAVAALRTAYPDAQVTIEELLAKEERVAARLVWRERVLAPYEARQFDFWGSPAGI